MKLSHNKLTIVTEQPVTEELARKLQENFAKLQFDLNIQHIGAHMGNSPFVQAAILICAVKTLEITSETPGIKEETK